MAKSSSSDYVLWFKDLGMHDVDKVGGKNASLGEMIHNLANSGVQVPDGFATTAQAYRDFLADRGHESKISSCLQALVVDDVQSLSEIGQQIRQLILAASFPANLEQAITAAFNELSAADQQLAVAVRSSATAEDLPDASFAGQQETFLNISGIDNVLVAIKEVFVSL